MKTFVRRWSLNLLSYVLGALQTSPQSEFLKAILRLGIVDLNVYTPTQDGLIIVPLANTASCIDDPREWHPLSVSSIFFFSPSQNIFFYNVDLYLIPQ